MADRVAHQALVPGSGDLSPQDVSALRHAGLERLIAGGHGSSLTSTIGAVMIQVEQGPFGDYVARTEAVCGDALCVRRTADGRGMTTSSGTEVTEIEVRTCRSAYPAARRRRRIKARIHLLAASGIQATTDRGVVA